MSLHTLFFIIYTERKIPFHLRWYILLGGGGVLVNRAIVDGILLSTGPVVDRILSSVKCYFDRVWFFDAF
jgi:hypothetical protein